jgi:transketolase
VLERFSTRFPDRYVNVGVSEQNMTGIAAGLAASGKIVFTYSIANFPTLRCLEQIRNDVCYHNANVKIVAVGGGLSYASSGYTHHAVEDLSILRTLPSITVLAPGDPVEARLVTRAAAQHPGPCYLRLGKAGEPLVHRQTPRFELGKALLVREGTSAAILSTGGMLGCAVGAADRLAGRGVTVQVLSLPTLVPLDETAVLDAARQTGRIVTVEEHGPGALADLVAETLLRHAVPAGFVSLRLPREACTTAGSQADLLSRHGLSVEGIVAAITRLL